MSSKQATTEITSATTTATPKTRAPRRLAAAREDKPAQATQAVVEPPAPVPQAVQEATGVEKPESRKRRRDQTDDAETENSSRPRRARRAPLPQELPWDQHPELNQNARQDAEMPAPEENSNENSESAVATTEKRTKRKYTRRNVRNAENDLMDESEENIDEILNTLQDKSENMTAERHFSMLCRVMEIMWKCQKATYEEMQHYMQLLKRENRVRDRGRSRKTSTRNPSGFAIPSLAPRKVVEFVGREVDPTPTDNVEVRDNKNAESWRVFRWINKKNNTCWRLTSNEPGAAVWERCERVEIARPQFSAAINQYIKQHNLEDSENKKHFHPDERLIALLGPADFPLNKKDADVKGYHFFNLQSYIKRIYDDAKVELTQ